MHLVIGAIFQRAFRKGDSILKTAIYKKVIYFPGLKGRIERLWNNNIFYKAQNNKCMLQLAYEQTHQRNYLHISAEYKYDIPQAEMQEKSY